MTATIVAPLAEQLVAVGRAGDLARLVAQAGDGVQEIRRWRTRVVKGGRAAEDYLLRQLLYCDPQLLLRGHDSMVIVVRRVEGARQR